MDASLAAGAGSSRWSEVAAQDLWMRRGSRWQLDCWREEEVAAGSEQKKPGVLSVTGNTESGRMAPESRGHRSVRENNLKKIVTLVIF